MSTKENKSIAYIYNEMDPSEKLEFERELMSDSDLLIEVESLKKVSKDLNDIEYFEPPAHVVDAVLKTAQKHAEESKNSYWRTFAYSAAALILVGMTSGIFLMDNSKPEGSLGAEPAGVSTTPVSSASENVTPWVDNNEILYFQGQSGVKNDTSVDSIRNESLKKLTPINPSFSPSTQRQLQLTGSNR